jgi:RpiR family transcriptional regulator, carbohydrate utilization regulator
MSDQQNNRRQSVIELVYQQAPYLNPTLRRIADHILAHPQETKTSTIKGLAQACGVAESSVTRFVKTIGMRNYQEMKIAIAEALTANEIGKSDETPVERFVFEGITRENTEQEIIENIARRSVQTILDTKLRLNAGELAKAADAITHSNVLVFCCMGSSGVAAEEGVMRFTRVGKKCLLFRDHSIQLMTASILGQEDAVIAISNSGRTAPVVECLKLARSKGAKTICITSFEDAPIVQYADIALYTSVKSSPMGPGLYRESMTAKSAQILVMDVLYAAFAARSFDRSLEYLEETYLAAIKDSRSG